MTIAIIGAGAMGCLYGAYLSKKNEVILINGHTPQVEAIRKNGIAIEETDGREYTYSGMKAFVSGDCELTVDLVIVFVKSMDTADAVEKNKGLFRDDTIVMTLQNGAGNDRVISKYVKESNIIVGTTIHNVVNLGGGKIRHTATGATVIGSKCNCQKTVEKVEGVLSASGLETEMSQDIQRFIWTKLFVNLSINPLTALLGTSIGYMIQNKYAWDFAKRIIYEAVEVAEADGTYFDRREVLEMVHEVCIQAGDGYASMCQDRKHKKRMEIDAINGAIVQQAKLYGVPTPYNALIVDLIHALEGTYSLREVC